MNVRPFTTARANNPYQGICPCTFYQKNKIGGTGNSRNDGPGPRFFKGVTS